ncbi:MAG: CPBP family intramembrane glutamic endopeptidase [Chloroflexota bacterium]
MNDLERKKTLWLVLIFSVLVNAVAWIAPLLGGSPSSPGPGFVLWGVAPLLVSLLMRAVTRDWSDLGIKPVIGGNIRWYIVSLLAIPALMVLALLVGVLLSVASITGFSLTDFLRTVLAALPIFLIFAIFEEVGWRGYLSPKLASLRINRYLAAALVAVVWSSWHLPYIRELSWVYNSEDLATFIPRFYLTCIALSVVYGEIRNVTATFWPAVLMHAVANSFGHPLSAEYVTFAAGMEYLGSLGNGLIFITFVIILGVAINRWRLEKSALSKLSAR